MVGSVSDCSFVRLEKRPDIVKVLEDGPLYPHEETPAKGSVKISVASTEHRSQWNVTAVDDQIPSKYAFCMWRTISVWWSGHHQTDKIVHVRKTETRAAP